MSGEGISIRPAEAEDCRLFHELRNSPEVRALSLDTDEIPYEEHERWFREAIRSRHHRLYVIVGDDSKDIGYVRFRISGSTALVSIALGAASRGKGVGTRALKTACITLFDGHPDIMRIDAQIKEENIGSMLSFMKAGFSLTRRGDPNELTMYATSATHDAGIILIHELDGQGQLDRESAGRADEGIALFKEGRVSRLILSGGHCYKEFPESLAETMEAYATRRGVPSTSIIKEESSLDTVGQIIFCKGIMEGEGMRSAAMISSNYHLPRIRSIVERVFGVEWPVHYFGVRTEKDIDPGTKEKEAASERAFLDMFDDVRTGDTESFKEALLKKHPYYRPGSR